MLQSSIATTKENWSDQNFLRKTHFAQRRLVKRSVILPKHMTLSLWFTTIQEKLATQYDGEQRAMMLAINKLPSRGDWESAESIFKDRNDVTYYILGPDDNLRQYEYRDRDEWKDKIEPRYWQRHHRRYPTGPEVDYELQPAQETGPAAQRGPFNDSVLDKAFAALMDGNSDALDRIAADFSRSPDGQQMRQLGDSLLAEQTRQWQLAQQEALLR